MAEPAGKYLSLLRRMSDEELIRILYTGNEQAFHVLWERHEGSLWRHVYRLTQKYQDACDVCQETWFVFLECVKNGTYVIKKRGLSLFLHRVARNAIITVYRQKRGEQRAIENLARQNVSNKGEDPAETVEAREIQANLKSALLKLPEKERWAIELKHYPPYLSFEAIGKILGVSTGTARNYVKRGENKLNRML